MSSLVTALGALFTDWWLASNRKVADDWLKRATQDDVLRGLGSNFKEGCAGLSRLTVLYNHPEIKSRLRTIFEAHGQVDSSEGHRYWTKHDLGAFLATRYPGAEVVQASIDLLWKCFHYHAYFPFPQPSTEKLDWSAFERAVLLLAAGGSARIGTDATGGIAQDPRYASEESRQRQVLWLLFRSLASRSPLGVKPDQVGDRPEMDDLLDVLALVQPAHPSIATVPYEEVEPHAIRIRGGAEYYDYECIPRAEFLALMRLLVSLQLDKAEEESFIPAAHIYPGAVPGGLADALLSTFITEDGSGDVYWASFEPVVTKLLPNVTDQFHLIFSPFLHPCPPSRSVTASDMSVPSKQISPYHAQYLSLFLVQSASIRGHSYESTRLLRQAATHYRLQESKSLYSGAVLDENVPLSLQALLSASAPSPNPYDPSQERILLITGRTSSSPSSNQPTYTIGAYLPTCFSNKPIAPNKDPYNSPRQLRLFQLTPAFKLLGTADLEDRGGTGHIATSSQASDQSSIDNNNSDADKDTDTDTVLSISFTSPSPSRGPSRKSTNASPNNNYNRSQAQSGLLEIDFRNGRAMLQDSSSSSSGADESEGEGRKSGEMETTTATTTTVEIDRVELFCV